MVLAELASYCVRVWVIDHTCFQFSKLYFIDSGLLWSQVSRFPSSFASYLPSLCSESFICSTMLINHSRDVAELRRRSYKLNYQNMAGGLIESIFKSVHAENEGNKWTSAVTSVIFVSNNKGVRCEWLQAADVSYRGWPQSGSRSQMLRRGALCGWFVPHVKATNSHHTSKNQLYRMI